MLGEAEHVSGVFGKGDEAESGLVDGEGAAEGLDMAAALDSGEVSGDLLLIWGGVGGFDYGLRVVEGATGLAGLLEHGVEASVERVLGYGFRHGHRLRRLVLLLLLLGIGCSASGRHCWLWC